MSFKKIVRKIHIVLGLSSGLIVALLGLTGCILAFELEIRDLTEPFQFTKPELKPLLPPSAIRLSGETALSSKKAVSVEYPARGRSAVAYYYDATSYEKVYI